VTDFLDEKYREIIARLKELEPVVEEFRRLEAAASALDDAGGFAIAPSTPAASAATPARRGPGRPRGSTNRPAGATATATVTPARRGPSKGRVGRRRGSGARSKEALSIVTERHGITISELASRMKIKQNYLYRVLPGLEQEGKVVKQGRGWHPKS
jgi:hypothetical protein